ncbi:MAG: hypothetical protein WCI97_01060 [Bacteroidota bacterium]
MKKLTLKLFSLSFLLFITACTKDRVADPSTLNTPQSVLYSESFDETSISAPALPAGWTTTPDSGWVNDSTNFSTGYDGASGNRNLVTTNDSLSSNDCVLMSKSISTTGYNKTSVTYGARRSKHFSDNGSSISSFAYSIDNGVNWINLPYTENTNDSNWYLINNTVRITLSDDASNQASLKFRWVAHKVPTPSGTYRIDDFQILGTAM